MSSQVLVRRATVRGRTLALAIAGALTASMLAVTPASGETTFERLGSLDLLESEEPRPGSAAVSDGTHAYFGVEMSSGLGSILKVKIDGLERVAAEEFPDTAEGFRAAAISGDFLYFGTNGEPARIVKVNKNTLASAGSILLEGNTEGVPADATGVRALGSLVAAHIDGAFG